MRSVADVVVIGGGCAGASIAWRFAHRGAGSVVLLEKSGIAAGATGLSSANVQTHYLHETLARMARRAFGFFENFEAETGGGTAQFHRTGQLLLVRPEDVNAAGTINEMLGRVGIGSSLLQPEELARRHPDIERADIGAAAWEPEAGYADPVVTTSSYVEAAVRHGAEIEIGAEATRLIADRDRIEGVDTSHGMIHAGTVVVAAGFLTRDLVAPLGLDLPFTPVRHTVAIVNRSADHGVLHPIIADRIQGTYYRPEGSELTLIGSTDSSHEREDPEIEVRKAPDPAIENDLVTRFLRRFPKEENAAVRRGYTGVYDCTPDFQAVLGPVRSVDGLHVAAGFSGHGFKFSPVVGDLVAERALTGGNAEIDIGIFAPERFEQDRLIEPLTRYAGQKV